MWSHPSVYLRARREVRAVDQGKLSTCYNAVHLFRMFGPLWGRQRRAISRVWEPRPCQSWHGVMAASESRSPGTSSGKVLSDRLLILGSLGSVRGWDVTGIRQMDYWTKFLLLNLLSFRLIQKKQHIFFRWWTTLYAINRPVFYALITSLLHYIIKKVTICIYFFLWIIVCCICKILMYVFL